MIYIFGVLSAGLLLFFALKRIKLTRSVETIIFEESADAIIAHHKGSIIKANKAFCNLFQYDDEDLESFHLLEIVSFEFRNLVLEKMQAPFNEAYFVTAKKKSGEHLYLEFKDIDAGKGITYTQIKDITPFKELETEVSILRQEVLQNHKLASVATTLSSFVHELNTPLTAINSFAEELSTLAPKEQLSQKIYQASKNMGMIVDQIRQYSRDGKYEQTKQISLKNIIDSAFTLLSHRLKSNNITHKIDFHFDDIIIWGNETQFQSIIQNFISNSCDSFEEVNDQRNKRIEIIVTQSSNSKCIIKYSDNANGMSPEITKNIFEPFFTTKNKIKGTGLGMSITKSIIEKHQGSVSLSSTPGIGTTFELIFPSIENIRRPVKNLEEDLIPLIRPKVLVIDDQFEIIEIISFFLQDYFEITGETDPEKALGLILTDEYDLIITDMEMPHISGLDVLDFIQINSPRSRSILISGHGDNSKESLLARKKGADLIISKPFAGRNKFLQMIVSLFPGSEEDFRLNL